MTTHYVCPACKTNKTRFHIIEQSPHAVKLNPQTGDVVEEYQQSELDPFHLPYSGPSNRIQCGACGLNEDERQFIRTDPSAT
ncbi:hypothetical protein JCM19037_4133 [Geomicrobium sp. JCM 19037]|uniref:hypothetical protein n=1 Tax=unclassified Geomicrobium TaxID=2628951 RepID=UPI00045F2B85|nr:hypothetical protein [Geomicrobium sp. JCM 19037]GAK05622.1 hypothetical protein JCM19037_4133 [Geomicrobium sp. JCM 19037]